MAAVLGDLHVCGNILSSAGYRFFVLQCTACSETFGQWPSFLKHLEQQHGNIGTAATDEFNAKSDYVDELKVESNFNELDIKDDLPLAGLEEQHSIFLETKQEIDKYASEADELMVEFIQVCATKVETPVTNKCKQIPTSVSSIPDNKPVLDGFPSSPAAETKADTKKFKFNLSETEYRLMSLDFLKVLEIHRILWDPKHGNYGNSRKRSIAQTKIKRFFKEKRIDISDNILNSTISTLLKKYKLAKQSKLSKGKVNGEETRLLQKCGFLEEALDDQVDDGDNGNSTSSDIADKDDKKLGSTYFSNKNNNRIPFSQNDPLFGDFIDYYKANPMLWDTSVYNYNHRLDRRDVLVKWCQHFKSKYNVQLTHDDLSLSILEFRKLYYKNVQRRETNAELDEVGKFILEKGSFLPPKHTIQHVKCDHCGKIFHQEHTLKRHIYIDHGIGEKPFKCAFCEQSFEDHLIHRRHEQRYHYKDYKYVCEYCQKSFFTRDELDRHILKHTGEKRFVCELCGRGFAKKTNLCLHNTRVHLRQRNFACSMCPKAFYTKRLLQDHINAHLNIRDKICPTCGKGFTSHHSLIRHKQIHSEIKKYACKLCNARFHQFVGLNSHMKNTHKYVRGKNETASDEDDRPPPNDNIQNISIL